MTQTFYDLLKLSPNDDLTPDTVKQAYRQALLKYHPDKVQSAVSSRADDHDNKTAKPTIDLIVAAYATLLDPDRRKTYDATLRSKSREETPSLGIETFDLEDFESVEEYTHMTWKKTCRCGSPEAYILTEQDLERVDEEQFADMNGLKEVLVGCRGCSLFIRVTFASAVG